MKQKKGGEITLSFTSPEKDFFFIFMKSLLWKFLKNGPLITTKGISDTKEILEEIGGFLLAHRVSKSVEISRAFSFFSQSL